MDLHLVLFTYKHAMFTTNHPVIIDSIVITGMNEVSDLLGTNSSQNTAHTFVTSVLARPRLI